MRTMSQRERTIYNALLTDTYGVKFKMVMRDTENAHQKRFPTISSMCEAIAKRQDARLQLAKSHVRGTGYFHRYCLYHSLVFT